MPFPPFEDFKFLSSSGEPKKGSEQCCGSGMCIPDSGPKRFPDPDLDFYPSRISDPGVKKAPDLGSATLVQRLPLDMKGKEKNHLTLGDGNFIIFFLFRVISFVYHLLIVPLTSACSTCQREKV